MKRLFAFAFLLVFAGLYSTAQVVTERCWHLDKMQFLDHRQDFWRSHKIYTTAARPYGRMGSALYSLTEIQYGFGLSVTDPPFSHHIVGATTAFGLQFGSGFGIGGGAGFLKYNDGYTVPVYADLRYFLGRQRVRFFVEMPVGFLLNFDNFRDYSRIFANPGAGITVPVMRNTHLSFSAGLLTQADRDLFNSPSMESYWRDSFLNLKLGLLFGR